MTGPAAADAPRGAIPAVTGIVLAGGAARRFGRNKLHESLAPGERLLDRAIAALSPVCTEVVVALAHGAPDPSPPVAGRVVRDPVADGGPLAGIVAGLEEAREALVLVTGGDMPMLRPDVIGLLVRRVAEGSGDAAALRYRGRLEPLPCVVRNGAALAAGRRLLAEGEGSVQALLRALRVDEIHEGDWRPLDPEARTLVDVDVPGDLEALRPADQGDQSAKG